MRHLAPATLLLVLLLPTLASAADAPTTAAAAAPHAVDTYPHPGVPEHPTWAKNLVAIITLMFVAAFLIGPIVRATMPQEVAPPHSHDEHGPGAHDDPHAQDHGHGHGHGHAGHH